MDCETEALKSSIPQLVARLKANDTIDSLFQANLLTQGEYESFCDAISQNSDHRIVNRNILIAVKKGPKGSVHKFEQILRESQPDLASELRRALFGAHRSVSAPEPTLHVGMVMQRQCDDDTAQPLASSSMPSHQPSPLDAVALTKGQPSPMDERVAELERQAVSHIEELSLHKERVAEVERLLKEATSRIEELSSHVHVLTLQSLHIEELSSKLEPEVFQTTPLLREGPTLHSEELPDLPIDTACATAVVIEGKVYVCGGRCQDIELARQVHVYSLDEKTWSMLSAPAPQFRCEAIAINHQLTLLGGYLAHRKITNIVSTWDRQLQCWSQDMPPMPTKRIRPCVVVYNGYVIAAGGMSERNDFDRHMRVLLDCIDILDTSTQQWWMPANFHLPRPMYAMTIAICSSHVFVAGPIIGYDMTTNEKMAASSAWQLPVSVLREVLATKDNKSLHQWTDIAPTPYHHSKLLKGSTHPLIIGGAMEGDGCSTRNISVYDPIHKKWSTVGQLREPRARCAAVSISSSEILVFGGYSETASYPQPRISSAEQLTVHPSW